MCQVTYFHHKTCHHEWAMISRPCAPALGFSNCPTFQACDTGPIKAAPRKFRTAGRACPRCAEEHLRVGHDRNVVRVVERMGRGVSIGRAPGEAGEEDWGVDVRILGRSACCAVL